MKQELFFAPLRVVLCAALLPEENQNNNEARQKYCRSPLPDGCERKECLKMTIDTEIRSAVLLIAGISPYLLAFTPFCFLLI